jgi:transposase
MQVRHIKERWDLWRRAVVANAGVRGRPIAPLILSPQERAYLERQVRRHRVARSLSERCRAILRCADGLPSKSVAAELGIHEHTVGKWRRRFLKDRCDGLLDEARPGRPRTINDDQVAAVIERTLRTTPADATHWSIRSMAAETGFSHTTIRRMWSARAKHFYLADLLLRLSRGSGTRRCRH